MWIHLLVAQRLLKQSFTFIDLRNGQNKFFDYFRMSIKKSFGEILSKLEKKLESQITAVFRFLQKKEYA